MNDINPTDNTIVQAESVAPLQQSQLRGVKGWLAFLCVILMIIGPVGTLLNSLMNIHTAELVEPLLKQVPEWKHYVWLIWAFGLIYGAISFYNGFILWKSTQKADLTLAKEIMICNSIFGVIAIGFLAPWLTMDMNNALIANLIFMSLRAAIFLAIWLTYLNKSKRVKNTYVN